MKFLILLTLVFLVSCQDKQIAIDGPAPQDTSAVTSGMAPVSGG